MVRFADDLQIVIGEADGAEPCGREHGNPYVRIRQVRPEQRRHKNGRQDQQTAHRRRAGFRTVRLRSFLPDDLADLKLAELANEPGTEYQADRERGQTRRGRANRDVANDVQHGHLRPEERQLIKQVVEHQANSAFSRSTTLSVRTPRDPLTSTRSPACTKAAARSAASSLVSK